MLYVLDEEDVTPLRLSAHGGLRQSHRKLQVSKKADSYKNKRQ